MVQYGAPVLYALFVWWFSTGLIVYLDGFPKHSFRWTMLAMTALLCVALYFLQASAGDTSVSGAYVGFTCGILAWGWIEVGFLMGPITGPRKAPCPPGCTGWRRAWLALQTILYHELAIIVLAAAMAGLTWGAANQVGTWTFLVLWGMRQSAKLNVFLGVRNLSDEFLPDHLGYLGSFLVRKPMNLLFPVSVTVGSLLTAAVVQRATADQVGVFEATGYVFVATMLALAMLDHWFLVVPLPATALWGWSLKSHAATSPAPTRTGVPDQQGEESRGLMTEAVGRVPERGGEAAIPAPSTRIPRHPVIGGSHELPEFLPHAARRSA
jgi:putative photosynthetic complex assembly protein 2